MDEPQPAVAFAVVVSVVTAIVGLDVVAHDVELVADVEAFVAEPEVGVAESEFEVEPEVGVAVGMESKVEAELEQSQVSVF